MKTIAIVSPAGGAGRSMVTASLASLLAARGHPVLALECDPRNVLGYHFGLRDAARAGLSGCLADGSPTAWAQAGLRSDDGVLFVPWGEQDSDDDDLQAGNLLRAGPHWLRGLIAQVAMPAYGAVLIDTPPWPSPHAGQAIAAADLVLVLLPPQPEVCVGLRRLTDALARRGHAACYVATRLQPARRLHADIVTLLRATLGDAMLACPVHEDSGIPEAFARSENFCRSAPHSQAAHDLQGLASWVSHWIGAPPQEPER